MRNTRTPERDRILGRARRRKYMAGHPGRETWRQMRRRALMSKQEIMPAREFEHWYNAAPKVCAYCNLSEMEAKKEYGRKLHVDRKDCSKGYVHPNICLACHRCNVVKSKYLTYDQMRELAQRYFLGINLHDRLVAVLRRAVKQADDDSYDQWLIEAESVLREAEKETPNAES